MVQCHTWRSGACAPPAVLWPWVLRPQCPPHLQSTSTRPPRAGPAQRQRRGLPYGAPRPSSQHQVKEAEATVCIHARVPSPHVLVPCLPQGCSAEHIPFGQLSQWWGNGRFAGRAPLLGPESARGAAMTGKKLLSQSFSHSANVPSARACWDPPCPLLVTRSPSLQMPGCRAGDDGGRWVFALDWCV